MSIAGQPKHVQEISAEGIEPPSEFFVKDTILAGNLGSVSLIQIPIIDLNLLLLDPYSEAYKDEINKLLDALSSWGVFQVIGHGMSSSYLEEIRNLIKKFFCLSIEEKQKYGRAADGFEGYGNDPIFVEGQVLDWCDRLFLTAYPQDQRNLQFWPQNPPNFMNVFEEYCNKVIVLTRTLLKIFARSQNLEDDAFYKEIGEKTLVQARFNLYPKCPKPDKILGVKAHADASIITTLLQDKEVEGLQVLKDGKWYGVPTILHALLINVGDQLEIMSNGIFKSPIHRVAANSEQERISLAVFYFPDYEKEIEPLQGLINSQRPQMFRKVKNYPSISFKSFHSGQIAIDTLRISPSQ
ncbi:protein SRG1-like [Solanum pennellii]|uniref:Protein SRG1-like n=1 Tax=Solanum pennellii TaxID=28526 RepID=A0ABM1H868_SOLPN|nr:protein SRG1-like [Solanum pennellii]